MVVCDKVLTIEALREFLGKRGLAKDKPKRELAALSYSAYTMNLPVLTSAKEHEEIRKKDYQNLLFVEGTRIPDHFTLYMNVGYLNKTA